MTALTSRNCAKVADVREWLLALGVLCVDNMTQAEAKTKIAAYVPMLQGEFPPQAFCEASLRHCARACGKFFPSYSELCATLGDWWKDNRPYVALPALPPPPPRPPPTPEEIEHVTRVVKETVAMLRSSEQPVEDYRPRPRHLTPAQLNQLNPLPNGRKRVDSYAAQPTAASAAADRPDPATADDDQATAG